MTGEISLVGQVLPLIVVMIRGRHRGLPIAIDRAVMLPMEFAPPSDSDAQQPTAVEEDHGISNRQAPGNASSGYDKSSDDAEWWLRRNARKQSNEELSIAERRKTAAKADQEAIFGY
ncbi:Potassium transport protein [Mycena sanguinolenta]|uniref:Potassium transport protein n=1 Tax=Mycena sanguinolenta TaxID=230812 RepID=A0A8H7CWT3_9AGAR|nr:Potassium transport protein [Mycena sanguinolenta]